MVIVRCYGGHAIIFVDEEGDALDGAGSPQRLVEVLTAEVIVYLQWLEEGRKDNCQTRQFTAIRLFFNQKKTQMLVVKDAFFHGRVC